MRRVCSIARLTRQRGKPPRDSTGSPPLRPLPRRFSYLLLDSYNTSVVALCAMAKATKPIYELDEALTALAKLYQFRSLEERGYAGLTVSQSYALRDLYFNGPRSMTELAGMLRVRLSTMTGVIDQLERKGYVERVDHPGDRRSFQV